MKVKGKATCYITCDVDRFVTNYRTMEPDQLIQSLVYYKPDCGIPDWTKVGVATITLELEPEGDIKEDAISRLIAEQDKIRKELEYKLDVLQTRIDSLRCLEHYPNGGGMTTDLTIEGASNE